MGRKRTRDFDLPPRMVRRRSGVGERFYYVTHDRRWIPLGSDLARAKRRWADLECAPSTDTVRALIERYLDECCDDHAHRTRQQYRSWARHIVAEWGDLPVEALRPFHIARWRDSKRVGRVTANGILSVLRVAYAKGVEWGYCTENPAKLVAFNRRRVRDRYVTDTEYRAIRAAAPGWLAIAMDLAYLTALRPIDLLGLQWSQVMDTIATRTRKTKVRMAFKVTDEVREVLDRAQRRPILGLYVVAGDKGRRITMRRMQEAWRAACEIAGIPGAQFRDIRAKAATDADREGLDVQALLGHSTRAMSERYVKSKRTIVAPALKRIADE